MQQSGIFPNINTPHASTVPDALDLEKLVYTPHAPQCQIH